MSSLCFCLSSASACIRALMRFLEAWLSTPRSNLSCDNDRPIQRRWRTWPEKGQRKDWSRRMGRDLVNERERELSLPLLLKVTFLSARWRTSVSSPETWWMSHSGLTLWAPYENECTTKPSTVKLTRELWSFPIKSKQFGCHGGVMEIHILRLGNPSP